MKLTLNQAAKECGRAKSTLSKAIKSGKLSAERGDKGAFLIDPSELHRVFPATSNDDQTGGQDDNAPHAPQPAAAGMPA